MTAIVVVVLLLAALIASIAAVNRRRFHAANQVVPGVATGAPASWAGAHTAEAKLHRRLRDAVAAARADPRADLIEVRAAVEQHALLIDERLVAVASLTERLRPEALAPVAAAVDALEQTVALAISAQPALDGRRQLDAALSDMNERMALLAQARTELESG